MIPLFTREEMRATDREASERYRIPSVLLMESAGAHAASHLVDRYPERLGRVLVIGGEGQNGGDGWVVARHLVASGRRPTCVLIGREARVRGDARTSFDALHALGVTLHVLDGAGIEALAPLLAQATLVVDALFGTGLARALEGAHARAVQLIAEARVPVCALDLPSGIDADTGAVLGAAVRATSTVTFAGHKRGLHQYPGREHAGEIVRVGIGAPVASDGRVGLIELSDVANVLVPLAADAHKGTRGHVLALAGSEGKTGAAMLAGLGALRAGAGLVTIQTDTPTQRALDQKVIELMTAPLADDDALGSVRALASGKSAALIGPGFGLSDARRALVRTLASDLELPLLLDADALTALAGALEGLQHAKGARVLTPHPGEAARLLDMTTGDVQRDRHGAAAALAERTRQVIVLKGAGTVIAAPDGRVRVCPTAAPALGVAGTGDVLSGVIAALLARNAPFEAAWAGVQLHALAGVLAAEGDRGLLASELAHALPRALTQLRSCADAHAGEADCPA